MPREPSAKYDSHGHENGHYYTANATPYSQPDIAGLSYMEPQQIIPVIQEPVPKKKHICSTCDRIFTTSGHLARHARVHTGEKNHQCPFPNCKTRCSRQDNLQQHYRIHLSPGSRRRSTAASRTAMIRSYSGDQSVSAKRGSQATLPAQLPPINYPSPPPAPPSPPLEPPALEQAYSNMPPGPDSPPPLVQAPLPALLSPYTDSGSSRSASPPECVLAPLSATNEFLPVANYPLGMPSQSQYGDGSPTYQDESHGGVYSFENGHSHSQSAAVDSNVHSNGIQEQPYAYTNSYGNHHATPHISSSPVQPLQHIDNPHASSASSPNQYSPVSSRHSISHISHPQAYSHSAPPYPPASLPPSPASAHSGSSHGSLASEPHTPVYTYQEIPEPNEYHSTDAGFGPISHTSSLPAEYYSSQNELVTNGFAAQLAPHVPGSYSHRYQPSPPILAPTQERLVHGEMQHAHALAQSACMSISAPPAQSQLSPYLHHPRPMSGAPQYHLPHVSIQRPDWEKHSLVLPAIHN